MLTNARLIHVRMEVRAAIRLMPSVVSVPLDIPEIGVRQVFYILDK